MESTLTTLAVKQIAPRPQVRTMPSRPERDKSLCRDIYKNGLIEPLIVTQADSAAPKGVTHYIVAGERRWRALASGIAQTLRDDRLEALALAEKEGRDPKSVPEPDLSKIPDRCEVKIVSNTEALKALQVRENVHREDLHWTDRVQAEIDLQKEGRKVNGTRKPLTAKELSDLLGLPESTIGNDLRIGANLIKECWEHARKPGSIVRYGFALDMVSLSEEDQRKRWKRIQGGEADPRRGGQKGTATREQRGVKRPTLSKLGKLLGAFEKKGYEHKSEEWREGARSALKFAAGQVQAFPAPKLPKAEKKAKEAKGGKPAKAKKAA